MPTAEAAPSAPFPPSTSADAKARLRRHMRTVRARLDGAAAGRDIGARLQEAGLIPAGASVAAFWPLADEIDLRPFLTDLAAAGHAIALPVVVARARPLLFRRWRPGDKLIPRGRFGIPEPADDVPAVRPDVLLVPLLAFDRTGRRLGYGAGHYDVTLAALAADGPVLSVGVAHAAQEVADLPADPWDVPLDVVVTERDLIPIRRNPD